MKRSRNPYPVEFMLEAVRLLKEQHLSRLQVVRDLGIDAETLRCWARELSPDSASIGDTSRAPAVALPNWPGCAAKTSNCIWSAIS
jgi:transposase-like protein